MVDIMLRGLVVLLLMLLASCSTQKDMTFSLKFAAYKALFIDEGRVVDTGNGNVSHSEGQGYGMLFAVQANDKETFDSLWQWTQQVLQRNDGLFSWRYRPCDTRDSRCIDDPNNASDGEILIAWALLRASEQWDNTIYKNAAINIIKGVEDKLIKRSNDLTLLLPGEFGFEDEESIQLNLSYWVFPALLDLKKYSDEPDTWQSLYDSGQTLLQHMQFSKYRLPSDWVRFETATQTQRHLEERLTLQNVISSEYGFNAVRIPLHLAWSLDVVKQDESQLFSPYIAWWQQGNVPATVSLTSGNTANYEMTQGMVAIRGAVKKILQEEPVEWPDINRRTDYYSASLTLLSMLAVMDNQ